jgi:undecaprenyl-diphosphatase
VLEAPKLLHHGGGGFSGVAILAGVVAGVVAFISTALIMRWFRATEVRAFDPFAIYCAVAGAAALAWLMLGH